MAARRVLALLLLGAPLRAEEVDATFEWSSIELAVLSPDPGREICLWESVVAVTGEGPLAGLTGRCLRMVRGDLLAARYEAEGHCVLTDARGDRLALRIERESSEGIAPPEGVGRWEGGTGRFAAAEGPVRFGLSVWGLSEPGRSRGTGRLRGEIAGLADPPAERPGARPETIIDPGWPFAP